MYETLQSSSTETVVSLTEHSLENFHASTERSHAYGKYTKAAIAFAGTIGTFLLAKITGWGPSWFWESSNETSEEGKIALEKGVLPDTLQPLNNAVIPVENEFQVNTYTNDGVYMKRFYGAVFSNVNPPVFVTNQLMISEGETLLLSSNNLSATDPDVDQDLGALNFTISQLQHGRFEVITQANVSLSSFLQGQIWNNTIQFIHDGGEVAPSYTVTVSDGLLTSPPLAANVNFILVNDGPALVNNNPLPITEGQKITLTSEMLSASDPDNGDNQIHFLVTNVQQGRFERVSNQGVAIFDFTQQEVKNGQIQFVHDNSEIAPSFDVVVSDGILTTTSVPGKVNYNAVNGKPQFDSIISLSLSEGQTVLLTSANIRASDTDSDAGSLVFTVSGVTHGYFDLASDPGSAITSFMQQQVQTQQVRFVHDGSSNAPAFFVSVSDGIESNAGGPQAAAITFSVTNDLPVITVNHLTITEGASVILTPANLSAIDEEDSAGVLTFSLQNLRQGKFENINNPGVEITRFTQQSLINGDIKFIHDGSNNPPSYDVTVIDSAGGTSAPQTVTVTFTPINDLPRWEKNQLSINQGETKILTSFNINTVDEDNSPSEIVIQVIEVHNGYFSWVSQPATPITQFTQQDINNGKVQFTQQGESAPAYILNASGPESTANSSQAAIITFIPHNNPGEDQTSTIIGATVGSVIGVAGILVGAGFCFFSRRKMPENPKALSRDLAKKIVHSQEAQPSVEIKT